jgi:hypothetical protein
LSIFGLDDGYQVTLVFDKPAAVGEDQIYIQLSDAKNSRVGWGSSTLVPQ